MERKYWNSKIETIAREELIMKIEKPLLIQQLDFVLENSQFYKDKFKKAGIHLPRRLSGFELSHLPFTEKEEIIEDQQEYPPFGKLLAVPIEKTRRVHRTSGYSGWPVSIVLTQKDIDVTLEAGARTFWCAGVRSDDIIVHCLNYCLWIGGLTDHLSLEQTGATVLPYGVGNSKNLIEMILCFHPTGISCTPSYLSRLELILQEEFSLTPRDLKLRKGIFGGEAGIQNPQVRKSIEERWGIKAVDANFGVSDVLSAFGSECEFQKGLHFHGQGLIYVELIEPATGENIEFRKGQIGEFVYTNLKREAQPLIRFRSHDIVEIVGVGLCECGRTGFRFKVLGRSDDMLTVKGINVFPSAISGILSRFSDLLTGEFEIYLDSPPPYQYLRIKVEYRNDLPEERRKNLKQLLQKKIRESLQFTAKIETVPMGVIPRSDGKAKKTKKSFKEEK